MKIRVRCVPVAEKKRNVNARCKTCNREAFLCIKSGALAHMCVNLGAEFNSFDILLNRGYIEMTTVSLMSIRALLEQMKS